LVSLLFAPSDVRLAVVPLSKAGGTVSDWSWSSPVSTDAPLSKRATPGTARARLEIALDRFFAGHPEERSEADAIVASVLDDERAEILVDAA